MITKPEESWDQHAKTLGFANEEAMLKHLYVHSKMSLAEIAEVLGYSIFTIRSRLLRLGVDMRPRGGFNNAGNRTLRDVPYDELMGTPTIELCKKYNVHKTTVYTERRVRKHELCTNSATAADAALSIPSSGSVLPGTVVSEEQRLQRLLENDDAEDLVDWENDNS